MRLKDILNSIEKYKEGPHYDTLPARRFQYVPLNGDELPMLNGYPILLVVPGYFATYGVKHLSGSNAIDREFDGFFMTKSYRLPTTSCLLPLSARRGYFHGSSWRS